MTAKKAAKTAKPAKAPKKAQAKPAKATPKPSAAKAAPTPTKPAAKPREPETKPMTDAERAAYEQGRTARLSSIDRRSAPHGKGPLRDAWRAGWDFQDGVAF